MSRRDLQYTADADLVALVRDGDAAAFDLLFRRHAGRVAGVCLRRVPAHDVDDVVQEVFLRALSHLDQLRDPASIGPWLRSIAVRCCAQRHRGHRAVTIEFDDVIDIRDDAAPLDEGLLRQEQAAELHRTLGTLSVRDREALWLRDALEVPIADIAARFGTTEGSTRVLLTRARRRMKAAYVAVIGWLVGLRSGDHNRLDRIPELVPAAAGMVAVSTVALAVLVGTVDAPTVPPAPPPSSISVVEVPAETTAAPTAARPPAGSAAPHMRAVDPVAAPAPPANPPSGPTDVGVHREAPRPDDRTWTVTVEDGENDPFLGLWVDGDEEQTDDDQDDEGPLLCVLDLVTGSPCDE